jgi:MtN3 and saliva related transmembrane protein
MDVASLFGFVAGSLTTLSFVPQVIRTFRTKRADDLSFAMLLAFGGGVLLWLVHGIMVHSAPIIAANLITLILVLVIAWLKVYYARVSRRGSGAVAESQVSM